MLRLPLVCTPPSIAIADEPLDDAITSEAGTLVSVAGLEIVPAWRARPASRRLLAAAGAVLVAGVAAALAIGRSHDDQAVRPGAVAARAGNAELVQPLVVSAHNARASVLEGR